MSADNEIAILEMREEGKFYVAMILGCPGVEEVECNEEWHKRIKKTARREKRIFDTYADAFDNAQAYLKEMVEEEGCPVEYGITSYKVPHVPWEER